MLQGRETLPRHRRVLRRRERRPARSRTGRPVLPRPTAPVAGRASSNWPSAPRGPRFRSRRPGIAWSVLIMTTPCSKSRRRKRDAVGLDDRKLKLLRGDCLNLKLGERFDWVCVFFNTFLAFTTLEEQDARPPGCAATSQAAGRFWVDIFQPDLKRLARTASRGIDPTLFYVPRYRSHGAEDRRSSPFPGAAGSARHVQLPVVWQVGRAAEAEPLV